MGRKKQAPPETDPAKAVAYLRVSTEEQNLGPEAQRVSIDAWAARQGVSVVSCREDHGVSGKATFDKRKGLIAALDDIGHHSAGWLVVAKRDRLARDVVVAAMIEQLVARAGARVTSADGVTDDDGPSGLLIRGIMDLFAQYERVLISTRTRDALRVKKDRGEKLGCAPFGYQNRKGLVDLIEDPAEQAALTELRRLHAEGKSLRQVVAALNEAGVHCRGKRWHLTTVADILRRSTG